MLYKLRSPQYLQKAALNGHKQALKKYAAEPACTAEELLLGYEKLALYGDAESQYHLTIIYMPDAVFDFLKSSDPLYWYEESLLRKKVVSIEKDCALALRGLDAALDASFERAHYVKGLWILSEFGFCTSSAIGAIGGAITDGLQEEALDLLIKAGRRIESANGVVAGIMEKNGHTITAYHYALKTIPNYFLGDPGLMPEQKIKWLHDMFLDIADGSYVPIGEDLTKLHEIQGMFIQTIDGPEDISYYENIYGDMCGVFVDTALPLGISD